MWNQVIGDQLFSEIDGGQVQGEPLPAREGIRIEPAAPDVARPRPMLSNLCMMMMLLSTQMVLQVT